MYEYLFGLKSNISIHDASIGKSKAHGIAANKRRTIQTTTNPNAVVTDWVPLSCQDGDFYAQFWRADMRSKSDAIGL